LYPGEGYFFFGDGDAVHWLSFSMMVKKISDLTLEEWLTKFDELLERESRLRAQMDSASARNPKEKSQQQRSRWNVRRKRS
jgi:ribosomal protein L29